MGYSGMELMTNNQTLPKKIQGSYLTMLNIAENIVLQSFSASWVVPLNLSESYGDQPFYIWNGVCSREHAQIIQPVLAWNRGGKHSKDYVDGWVINVIDSIDEHYVYHSSIRVSPGDRVTGFVKLISQSLDTHGRLIYTYVSGFEGNDYHSSQVQLSSLLPMNQLIICLEPWKRSSIIGYPDQDYVAITDINAKFSDSNGEQVSSGGQWIMIDQLPFYKRNTPSGYNGVVITDGIKNGEVRFYFR